MQIYACTAKADGTTAFSQLNVRAELQRGIQHSFVTPTTGPPQWRAPDGSAVTGTVVTKTPNGNGSIPTLELTATQAGRPDGLLGGVTKISRINTRGGVAPTGACTTGNTVEVPYSADYVFSRG